MASVIPEVNNPGCRWPHTQSQLFFVTYKWGDRLQVPGTLWRNAFESGLSSWNGSPILPYFYYDQNSSNTINTYDDSMAMNRGITYIYCSGTAAIMVVIQGNVYWDSIDNYTVNQRRGISTHEIGHGMSIGHINDSYPTAALMYKSVPLSFFSYIFSPQPPDIDFVDQIYP